MVRRSDGKAARARRIALCSSAALATLLVAGCERDAEHDTRGDRNRAQLPYQLAVALPVAVPAPPLPKIGVAEGAPRPPAVAALVAPKAVPSMPAPTIAPPLAFVIEIAPPAAAPALPPPVEMAVEAPSALTAVSPTPEAAPAIAKATIELAPAVADAEPVLTVAANPFEDRLVYIPQISQSVRAAYIAQVDAAAPGQRLAVRAGDTVLGTVQFQVADGVVSVNVGQVLDLFEGRFDSARFAELRGSHAAQSFVSLDQLQGAGIPLEYNAAYDELTLAAQRG
jgi:hypothetical protein